MRVRLLAFATAADALGSETTLELAEGATVADLLRRLAADHATLARLGDRLAIAVDGELVPASTPLRDGMEVALLPPVSGGAPALSGLQEEALDPAAAVAAVSGPRHGAIVLFVGTVRDHHRGATVRAITYSAYRPMAAARLERLAAELEGGATDLRVAIVHRLGRLAVGEASVVIAVAAPHREAAFATSRTALERLKREVPIWKREEYADGTEAWREEEPLAVRGPEDEARAASDASPVPAMAGPHGPGDRP